MSDIDPGKRIGVRWSGTRIQHIEDLGWQDWEEGAAIDTALERAKALDEVKDAVRKARRGTGNLLSLLQELDEILSRVE